MSHLYFIQSANTGMIKIGRSKNPEKRLKQLQTGSPNKLKLIAVFEDMGDEEYGLHQRLREYKVRSNGEWFRYECVGSIPSFYYEKIRWGSFDDWWVN